MKKHDIGWRVVGAIIVASGWAVANLLGRSDGQFYPIVALFGIMIGAVGLLLAIQGRHLPAAMRVEKSRHRELPQAIRARRVRQREGRDQHL